MIQRRMRTMLLVTVQYFGHRSTPAAVSRVQLSETGSALVKDVVPMNFAIDPR